MFGALLRIPAQFIRQGLGDEQTTPTGVSVGWRRGQLRGQVPGVVTHVDDIAVGVTQQPDDDRWQAVSESVPGQFGGDHGHALVDIVLPGGNPRSVRLEVLMQAGAYSPEVIAAFHLPGEQLPRVRRRREQPQ